MRGVVKRFGDFVAVRDVEDLPVSSDDEAVRTAVRRLTGLFAIAVLPVTRSQARLTAEKLDECRDAPGFATSASTETALPERTGPVSLVG